ncbi:MAG: hypothetical protein ABJH64_14640 [Algoriphagus sp.]|uniref:hypothetical protein n=1 Tax=Algoriphagus sp. TaxID=1872435 RepID=UPI00329A7E2B
MKKNKLGTVTKIIIEIDHWKRLKHTKERIATEKLIASKKKNKKTLWVLTKGL